MNGEEKSTVTEFTLNSKLPWQSQFHGIKAFHLFSKVICVPEFECAILDIDPYQNQFMHF